MEGEREGGIYLLMDVWKGVIFGWMNGEMDVAIYGRMNEGRKAGSDLWMDE